MPFSHAGGVVFREANDSREYLVVRANRSPAWVFPKGHIERRETPEECALREVAEEAGVRAEVVGPAGETSFEAGCELVRVAWFAMRYLGEVARGETRDRRWCAYPNARRALGYDNLREILDGVEAGRPRPGGSTRLPGVS